MICKVEWLDDLTHKFCSLLDIGLHTKLLLDTCK